jgi:sarcosine oxidase
MMIGKPDSEVVAGVMRSIMTHNMPHETLSAEDVRARYPMFQLDDDEVAVYEKNAGYLQAECCWASYIALARMHGAELRFEEPMLRWQVNSSVPRSEGSEECGVEVHTPKGTYRAKKLVLSVGGWAPSVYGMHLPQLPLQLERRVLYWFCPGPGVQEGFAVRPSTYFYLAFLSFTS